MGQYTGRYSPNEILTVGTKRRLFEKSGNEMVILNIVNIFFLQSTFSPT